MSPEFGDKAGSAAVLHYSGIARKQMEKDLGTDLEWVAAEHHDTEHPHVHVVIRGVRDNGETLRLSREYVQQGIRGIAADLCTRQLGYRTELDGAEAEGRAATEKRLTSIDKRLLKDAQEFVPDLDRSISRFRGIPRRLGRAKLRGLVHDMTLHASSCFARWASQNLRDRATWRVRRDIEQVLRAMQRTADRQRSAGGARQSFDAQTSVCQLKFCRSEAGHLG